MGTFRINGNPVSYREGDTVLQAAARAGIDIPSLCTDPVRGAHKNRGNSCMVCGVAVTNNGAAGQAYVSSCSLKVEDGLEIAIGTDQREKRIQALEFLLSEHQGDCEAPCRRVCPIGYDIPYILEQLERGDTDAAGRQLLKSTDFPNFFEMICPAPCEKACRRGRYDSSIAIRNIMIELSVSAANERRGGRDSHSVALFGSGPGALGAAHRFKQADVSCTLYGTDELPGGAMRRYADGDDALIAVLDREIGSLLSGDITYRRIDPDDRNSGRNNLDGHFTAMLETDEQLLADGERADLPIRVLRAYAQGRDKARDFLVRRGWVRDYPRRYDSIRPWSADEITLFAETSGAYLEHEVSEDHRTEASRCLQCACAEREVCRLRTVSTEIKVTGKKYRHTGEDAFARERSDDGFVFEQGKCIKCGACVELGEKIGNRNGPVFVERSYGLAISAAPGMSMADALEGYYDEFAEICPTGAMTVQNRGAE